MCCFHYKRPCILIGLASRCCDALVCDVVRLGHSLTLRCMLCPWAAGGRQVLALHARSRRRCALREGRGPRTSQGIPSRPSLGPTVASGRDWLARSCAARGHRKRRAMRNGRDVLDRRVPQNRRLAAPAGTRPSRAGPRPRQDSLTSAPGLTGGHVSARWSSPFQVDPEVVERLFRVAAPDGLRLATDGLLSILAVRTVAFAEARRGGCCQWALSA